MKTDRELQEEALKALEWEPGVDADNIGVSIKNGVATLQGNVRTYLDKSVAERVTRNVYGIRAVANDLTVTRGAIDPHSDSQIAEVVANALAWNSAVPPNAVKATVTLGWVTLHGDVEWQYQKSAAQTTVERLLGVQGVTNLIVLKPGIKPTDVKAKIEGAFKRSAEIDSARIKVEADGGKITLTGTVTSLHERDEAERAAWSAPGVTVVDDRITVTPF
jgi:osmotically-inducible protein OsmY